jgi:predicted SprT family Zn-dependent metalloprotease
MLKKRLEKVFIAIIFIATIILAKNWYDSYSFSKNDIPMEYKQRIADKEKEILKLMKEHYGYSYKVPIIITDEFNGRLYGLTSYKNGEIKIYLNKKVMKESIDYIVDNVISHEYAHALMFIRYGGLYSHDDGHSDLWKQTCINLGGLHCGKYVNTQDVILNKLPF